MLNWWTSPSPSPAAPVAAPVAAPEKKTLDKKIPETNIPNLESMQSILTDMQSIDESVDELAELASRNKGNNGRRSKRKTFIKNEPFASDVSVITENFIKIGVMTNKPSDEESTEEVAEAEILKTDANTKTSGFNFNYLLSFIASGGGDSPTTKTNCRNETTVNETNENFIKIGVITNKPSDEESIEEVAEAEILKTDANIKNSGFNYLLSSFMARCGGDSTTTKTNCSNETTTNETRHDGNISPFVLVTSLPTSPSSSPTEGREGFEVGVPTLLKKELGLNFEGALQKLGMPMSAPYDDESDENKSVQEAAKGDTTGKVVPPSPSPEEQTQEVKWNEDDAVGQLKSIVLDNLSKGYETVVKATEATFFPYSQKDTEEEKAKVQKDNEEEKAKVSKAIKAAQDEASVLNKAGEQEKPVDKQVADVKKERLKVAKTEKAQVKRAKAEHVVKQAGKQVADSNKAEKKQDELVKAERGKPADKQIADVKKAEKAQEKLDKTLEEEEKKEKKEKTKSSMGVSFRRIRSQPKDQAVTKTEQETKTTKPEEKPETKYGANSSSVGMGVSVVSGSTTNQDAGKKSTAGSISSVSTKRRSNTGSSVSSKSPVVLSTPASNKDNVSAAESISSVFSKKESNTGSSVVSTSPVVLSRSTFNKDTKSTAESISRASSRKESNTGSRVFSTSAVVLRSTSNKDKKSTAGNISSVPSKKKSITTGMQAAAKTEKETKMTKPEEKPGTKSGANSSSVGTGISALLSGSTTNKDVGKKSTAGNISRVSSKKESITGSSVSSKSHIGIKSGKAGESEEDGKAAIKKELLLPEDKSKEKSSKKNEAPNKSLASKMAALVDTKNKVENKSPLKKTQPQDKLAPMMAKFDYFQVVVTNDNTDMMVRLPSSPDHTFEDLRREIEEDAADDLPFPSFKFTVEVGGMGVYRKQEKKWKVRDYDLTNLGDGSYKHPYRVYIKEDKK